MLRSSAPFLTLEAALFGAIIAVGFLLRFLGLDQHPLAPAENLRALAAWQLTQGQLPQWWDAPALVLTTALGFLLFGANDGTARLVPALVSAGTIAALWAYRDRLGRGPALVGAALLALSPTAISVGRMAAEESLAALLTLLLGRGLVDPWEDDRPFYTAVGVSGMAVLLHLGYAGLTGVMALVFFGVASYALRPQGTGATAPLWIRQWRRYSLPFLGTFLLVGTGLFLFPGGFGLPGLQAWVHHFDPTAADLPWYQPWLLLFGYELPVMALGLPALAYFGWRWLIQPLSPERALCAFLSTWALLGLLFFLLTGEPSPSSMFVAALPLTLLAGFVLGSGLAKVNGEVWKRLAPMAVPSAVLLGYAVITLSKAAQEGERYTGTEVLMACVALVVVVLLLLAPILTAPRPWAMASLAILSLAVPFTIHSASQLPFSPSWPGSPHVDPYGVTTVTAFLRLSAYTGEGRELELAVEADLRASLGWYFREVPRIAYVTQLHPGPTLMVVREGTKAAVDFPGYQRLSVPWVESWSPKEWDWRDVWRWFLLGEQKPESLTFQRVTVLLKV